MAKAVAEGAKNAGNPDVELNYHVEAEELSNFDAILIGAPTYHHDMPIEMKKLFEEAAAKNINLKRKVGATFGSYGWSGEAVKLINKELEAMKFDVIDPGLRIQYVPDKEALEACHELGRKIGKAVNG